MRGSVAERIEHYIDRRPDGCWIWTASTISAGYAQLAVKREDGTWAPARVHRLTYEAARGPIPDGLVLDHLCRNRRCVNPDHLEAVTDGENIRRGMSPVMVVARSGRCGKGHEMAGSNLQVRPNGRRRCLACSRAYATFHNRLVADRKRRVA